MSRKVGRGWNQRNSREGRESRTQSQDSAPEELPLIGVKAMLGGHELLNKAGVIKPVNRGWKGQAIIQGSDTVRELNVIIQTEV